MGGVAAGGSVGDGADALGPVRARRLHVLCVDDDPDVLLGLRLVLRRRFAVTTATSGAEALTVLAAERPSEPPVGVVLSDLRMPGLSGAQLLAAVRRQRPGLPRLLLTGRGDAGRLATEIEIAAEIEAAGVFRLLQKPCPTDVLVAAILEASEQAPPGGEQAGPGPARR